MARSNSEIFGRLVLLCVSSFLTLAVAEVVFRVVDFGARYHEPRISNHRFPTEPDKFGLVPFGVVVSTYASDPRGYFEAGNTVRHAHNSVGFRDREHSIERSPKTFRIFGIGDSYLWGQGVRREDRSMDLLENLLQAATCDSMSIEVINAGQRSMNTLQERDLLIERGLAYEPNLVMVHYVLNDIEGVHFFQSYTGIYEYENRPSGWSRVYGFARQIILREIVARDYVRNVVESFSPEGSGWLTSQAALLEMRDASEARKAKFLLVVWPFFHELDGDYPFQAIHDTLRNFGDEQGISVLDLRESFRDYNGPELWVHPTDQHPNEIANRIAGQAIAEHLLRYPEIYEPCQIVSQRSSNHIVEQRQIPGRFILP